jgi:hypothetical protein
MTIKCHNHIQAAHKLSCLLFLCPPLKVIRAHGYTIDTFEALIVNNKTLSNVQKFHYVIASFKNEARAFISNLQITHENFSVAWQLVIQHYNNKRLIAMMHAKHLCQIPLVRKGDAPSLHELINHF